MRIVKPLLAQNPEAFEGVKTIYDAEAIFSLRDIAKRRVRGEAADEAGSRAQIAEEMGLVNGIDTVLSVSQTEGELFRQYHPDQVYVLGHVVKADPTPGEFRLRSDILFVGAIYEDDSPNADSLVWFVNHVLPAIRRVLPDVRLQIVGPNQSKRVLELTGDSVIALGKVDDLAPYFNQARIFVAPTRFAAGIPIKVYDAAAHGLPIFGTSLIAAQVGWQDDCDLLVADEPAAFAARCVRLYQNETLWKTLRLNALTRIGQECSRDAFRATLKAALSD